MHLAGSLADLEEQDWRRLQGEILADLPTRSAFAPHLDLIHRRAFDAVRASLLAGAARPPQPPLAYQVPKANGKPGAATAGHYLHALMQPAEEALFTLLAAAAASAAERAIDRSRVFSAAPTAPGADRLFTSARDWARNFSTALAAASPADRFALTIDVSRCGATLDRSALLDDLAGLGLSGYWTDVARGFWASFEPHTGPRGLPGVSSVDMYFVTLALRSLDEWCAGERATSFRVVDDTVIFTGDRRSAERLADGAEAVLARHGFSVNRDKSRVRSRQAFFAERRTQSARMIGPDDDAAAALRLVTGTAITDPRHRIILDGALGLLGRQDDPAALDHVIDHFVEMPASARGCALYLARFMKDEAVARRVEALLAENAARLHPWQWMWGLSAFRQAPRISRRFATTLARLVALDTVAPTVRVAAAAIWPRFASRADWTSLEALAGTGHCPHLRAELAHGLRHRPAAERAPLLRQWAAGDPMTALVAAAVGQARS